MSITIGPLSITPVTAISNDAWCSFSAIAIAFLLWSFDKPTTPRGRHRLFPVWLVLIALTSFGSLCFYVNLIPIGKLIVLFEIVFLLFVSVLLFFVFFIAHLFDIELFREGDIHKGIKTGDYFSNS